MVTLQDIQRLSVKKVPVIRTGHTVRVHQKIKEGDKERVQIFEGLVIKMNSGYGADKTFTVRKIVEGIGVERVFPLYSPKIEKIEVKKESKVRRAKLHYMRDRSGKSARLKETFVQQEAAVDEAVVEAEIEKLAEEKAKEEAMENAETEVVAEDEVKVEADRSEEPAHAPEVAEAAVEEEKKD